MTTIIQVLSVRLKIFQLSIAFFLSSGVTPSQYLSTFLTLEFSDVFSVTLTIGLTTGLPDWVSGSLAFVLDSVFGSLSFLLDSVSDPLSFAWFSLILSLLDSVSDPFLIQLLNLRLLFLLRRFLV
nr:hypothetical protein [Mycoplasmopsis bovis]